MKRIPAIDQMRGVVMLLMLLDHVRAFWLTSPVDPLDLTRASTGLFLTRWITHICAPVFLVLSGLGIGFSLSGGRTKKALSRHLITRGCLLILLEIMVFSPLWMGARHVVLLQVIWVLGMGMVVMAGYIWLPKWVASISGLMMCVGQHLLPQQLATQAPIVKMLYQVLYIDHTYISILEGGQIQVDLMVLYTVIPWIGLMLLGFGVSEWLVFENTLSKKRLSLSGLCLLIGFLLVRAFNGFGNYQPWRDFSQFNKRVLSFINVEKYPASLAFILLTLGLACFVLVVIDSRQAKRDHHLLKIYRILVKYHSFLSDPLARDCFYKTTCSCLGTPSGGPGIFGSSVSAVPALCLKAISLVFVLQGAKSQKQVMAI